MTDPENQNLEVTHKTPSKGSSVRWNDAQNVEDQGTAVGEPIHNDGFLARQKRRISEHPKITKIQLARQNSKHNITFMRKALIIMASSTLFKIAFFILRLIPISKIIMSVIFYNDCPAEPFIPVYLLVGGILACIRDCLGITVKNCMNEDCLLENEVVLSLIAFLYTLSEFIWFIFGSYYVYKNFDDYPWDEKHNSKSCNNILFMYSFVVTSISYLLLVVVFLIYCCTLSLATVSEPSTPKKNSDT
ncbi:hypothetical protein BsWGS_03456 [Bradybaena similaris]